MGALQRLAKKIGIVGKSRSEVKLKGFYRCKLIRDGEVVDEWDADNIVVNQGLDHILGVEFAGVPQITAWYIGLFKGNYAPVGTDTAATFPGNAQESTSYGQVRQTFTVAEGNQSANNAASVATFTFTAVDTIYGAFLISSQATSSTQGVLFSAVTFNTSRSVQVNDQLAISYAVNAASA